mmetsp:Transcript_79217/g.183825  ORF Transcript_79217/g.183825 Transcript_79217/m.183825 type:complete len:316 (+) Transcript_79217:94-1041(+)
MALDVMQMLNQLQNFVHGSTCTLVLPGMLLVASAVMLAYRHVTEDRFDLPLNGFLANILLQMMPLVALKAKIWSCNDRVSLVPLVLVKTLLMHVILGIMRILSQVLQGGHISRLQLGFDTACLVSALAILRYVFEFPLSLTRVLEQRDVRNLVILATGAAFLSEAFFIYIQPSWMSEATRVYTSDGLSASKVFFVAANYVDIVAFMPVVWRLYQADNELEDCAVGTVVSVEARRQVQLFFIFVGSFYLWDDVIDPIMGLLEEPVAMMAHAAHFMLLLDFAGFFIFQVGNPNTGGLKERGEQLQGLLSPGALDQDD